MKARCRREQEGSRKETMKPSCEAGRSDALIARIKTTPFNPLQKLQPIQLNKEIPFN